MQKLFACLILYARSRKGQNATAEPDSALWTTTCVLALSHSFYITQMLLTYT